MNIAILSRGENLYSTQSLLKAGKVRNHDIEVIDPALCTLAVEDGKPTLYYCNEPLNDLHAVIPRIGASNTYFGTSLVRHFESMGVFCAVSSEAILQSRNKWTSFQILSAAQIAVPKTVLGNALDSEAVLEMFENKPVILKMLQGTHGHGVILAETYQSALSTIETLKSTNIRFVIQEFIAESKGADIRVIVVDGVAVASMKRQCKIGEFRSNLHRGGTSEVIKLSYEEERLAIRAAKALRLGVCGVDLLQSDRGPMVLEVNSTPGLEGIETTTGKNISKSIIGFIERNKR
ncbi:ATP-grasp domain-containing protein [Constantimarinum furrinae]|uniref:N-acetylaspartylglutamate/N-acetylaspartylglutamylglutamate synthase n=1 Tax=Constantimarinum furrinae TaxID=2562285 RepID=A0A7G8PSQ3_9FLAO|nr:RimK family alpha-L-glutamate ligase [Constantimarinum furrinae]QNJ97369.1 N-acetylaspartylglutamate/N-acetylaspartylglutamylglutamate synthase [Constantimarinum furrinae]